MPLRFPLETACVTTRYSWPGLDSHATVAVTIMASFRCEPPLIAFSDFSTTEPLRQRLYIVNAAPVAQRFGATLLTGDADRDCWRLEVEPLGTVAPGGSTLRDREVSGR